MNSSPRGAGTVPLVLIDTSSWNRVLRPSAGPNIGSRVQNALARGQACRCPLVQLELWNGAQGRHEQKVLRDFVQVSPELPIDGEVWQQVFALARGARSQGVTVPTTDLMVAACPRRHDVALETADSDFELPASVR